MILMILMKNKLKFEVNVFREINFENGTFGTVFFEGVILKSYFVGDQFWQYIFLGINFLNVFFERAMLKTFFLIVPKVS